ncbi:MAG: SDR family oxidoreductase [Bryobacteraceae bacterium]
MPRYLVTGGAGFIGSALVRALLATGEADVEVIDNLLTGHEQNLAEVRDSIRFHNADIRDRAQMIELLAGVDTVFHLAAIPSVPRSVHEPVPSHEVNIDGTFNVFHAAAEGKVRRIVYAASSSAYGDTPTLPKVETMTPNPKSPYAAQKLMGEYYASVFYSCFGLESVCLRFFNVYGPRQDPTSPYSGVLSLFMKHLLAGTSPTVFGDGEQTRDFTFVEDVAALCMKAAQAEASAAQGRTYNAGNGNKYSLNLIWDLLQKMEGVKIPAKYGPPRVGDVRDSMADTRAAVAALGHAPKFTIEEGLKKTLEWYRATDLAAGA